LKRIALLYKRKIFGVIFSKDREVDQKKFEAIIFMLEMNDIRGQKLLDY